MVNQKLIAEKAGVSYATVSRAFTKSAKVKEETLQKIKHAMNELGMKDYDDLFLGNSILSKTVLVVVGEIASEFYRRVVSGIYEKLNSMSYSMSLCISKFDSAVELRQMELAMENRFAGIIMITVTETEEMVSFLRSARIPVILVNRYIRSIDIDVVRIDNYRGGYLAAEYLIDNGHKKIMHLAGHRNSSATQDRLRGFTDALADHGIAFNEKDDIYYGNLSLASGREFIRKINVKDYSAIFVYNDLMAIGATHELIKEGYKIPNDISVICYDDSPMINEDGLNITSISYNPHLMGIAAADTLMARLNDLLGERIKIIYSPHLRIRKSVRNIREANKPQENPDEQNTSDEITLPV